MKSKINFTSVEAMKLILMLLGIISQLIGYIGLLKNIIYNPYYSAILITIGFVVLITVLLEIIFRKENIVTNLVLSSGESYKKKTTYYNQKIRAVAFIGLLLFGVGYLLFIQRELTQPFSPPILKINQNYEDYQIKPNIASIADVDSINWFMAGTDARVGSDTYPFAGIIDSVPESITTFYGDDCALSFYLSARPHVEELFLEKFLVRVISYKPLPEAEIFYPAPIESASVYYVEIDDPGKAGKNIFDTVGLILVSGNGMPTLQNTAILRVANKSEYIIVRINAKTPGVYTFSVDILIRSKETKERILLVEETTWLFDY